MKFLAILVFFAFVGRISSAPRESFSPKVIFRMDPGEDGASDETDVEVEDEEPLGDDGSSEEIPEWSFKEVVDDRGWQHPINHVQQGGFQKPSQILRQGPTPIRRFRQFRDDESDEEEDDEEDDDEDDEFNDDVVHSDIQYSSSPSSSGVGGGSFRFGQFAFRGRATPMMTRRPDITSSMTSYPMSSYNRISMPIYNRMQMSNGVYTYGRPSYGGNRRVVSSQVSNMPYRNVAQRAPGQYPVRRVTPTMVYRQPQKSVMVSRPMVHNYNRYQTPIRQTSFVPNSYTRNQRPMVQRPLQYYYSSPTMNQRIKSRF